VKLIPNVCISQSEGEKILFQKFQGNAELPDVVGLHSLNLAEHPSQAEGEADFVLVVPKKGILIVEVKDHTKVAFEHGKWILGNNIPEVGGPIKQAREACYSVIDFIKSNLKEAYRVPITYCVWFTKTDFRPPTSIEWEPWQFLNLEDLEDVAGAVNRTLDSAINNFKAKRETSFIKPELFTIDLAQAVVSVLRPKFEFLLSESALKRMRKAELIRLLDEQYEAIDGMEDNRHVLVSGPAGTGKTLLALEKLRRLNAQGKKAKFICFNTSLAAELAARNLDLDIENLSKVTYRLATESKMSFLDIKQIEEAGPNSLTDESDFKKYDALVIDEAQDLFTPKYLPWIDFMLKGGLTEGEWYAFGDFESQNLYSTGNDLDFLKSYSPTLSRFRLKHNCRNLPLIGHLTYSIVPDAPKWKSFRRKDDGVDPVIRYTGASGWDISYLDDAIDFFRREKFSFPDIVVLTPNKISNPEMTFSNSKYANKFANWSIGNDNKIRFSTIHSFKGLESPCILLLELYELKNFPDYENLKYVALTRATDRLYIVANADTEKLLERR
jgi:DNA polymerase III delta prime subunit